MIVLNRFFGGLSGLSGLGLFAYAASFHDLTSAFGGVSAITIAVMLFQLTDVRERTSRIEALLMTEHHQAKRKAAGQ